MLIVYVCFFFFFWIENVTLYSVCSILHTFVYYYLFFFFVKFKDLVRQPDNTSICTISLTDFFMTLYTGEKNKSFNRAYPIADNEIMVN